jgi:hypothetical protein
MTMMTVLIIQKKWSYQLRVLMKRMKIMMMKWNYLLKARMKMMMVKMEKMFILKIMIVAIQMQYKIASH